MQGPDISFGFEVPEHMTGPRCQSVPVPSDPSQKISCAMMLIADSNSLKKGVQIAVRAAVAGSLSVAIAQLFGLQYPIYAFLAAVIVTDLAPSRSRQLGLQRLVATMVGAICGAAISPLFPSGPLAIGFGVLVAMLICELLRASDGAKIAGYICGIVVLDHSTEPWHYALFRFIETALGIAVALAVSYVPKLL